MDNYSAALDATFGALAHPIRREILTRLAYGEAAVTELATPFNISLPAMLKHIGILEKVGLLVSKKEGRVHICRLNAAPMQEAAEWLAFYQKYWNRKLDALGEFLEGNGESSNA
jgi:DNA-binding transcriptional ArsR family regulator